MAAASKGSATAGPGPAYGLRLFAVMLGVFFVANGAAKVAWFADSTILSEQLQQWRQTAAPSTRWYLDTIAAPGVPLFARLVPLAELSAGAALILGIWIRLAASLAFVMVANFHFARGFVYQWEFLADGASLPVLGGLLALALGGAKLPFSLSKG